MRAVKLRGRIYIIMYYPVRGSYAKNTKLFRVRDKEPCGRRAILSVRTVIFFSPSNFRKRYGLRKLAIYFVGRREVFFVYHLLKKERQFEMVFVQNLATL